MPCGPNALFTNLRVKHLINLSNTFQTIVMERQLVISRPSYDPSPLKLLYIDEEQDALWLAPRTTSVVFCAEF